MLAPCLTPGRVGLVALSAVLAGACSAPRTPLLMYSLQPGSSPGGVLVEGTIALSPNSRCVELLVVGEAPIGLIWPAGFSATFDPLRIYNEAGVEVASDGRKVTIGGDVQFTPSAECRTATSLWVYQISSGGSRLAS